MRFVLFVLVGAAFVELALPSSGRATFPGADGLIVFTAPAGVGPARFVSIDPRKGSLTNAAVPNAFAISEPAAWSPDAGGVAFVRVEQHDPRRGFEPYVYLSRSGVTRRIGRGAFPVWSPDGTRIAFAVSGSGVFVFDLRTGRTRRVASFGGPPAWSPDGTRLVFGASHLYGRTIGLWIARATGGARPRLLARVSVDERPAWSPDGRRIAFVDDRRNSLRLFDLRSRRTAALVRSQESGASAPAWSEAGGRIAFLVDGALHMARGDGTHRRALTTGGDVAFAWSPDGKSIAVSDRSTVSIVDLRTARIGHVYGGPHFELGSLSWSSSERIRVASVREVQHIALANPDGSQRRLLTTGLWWDSGPRWSADGRRIAFASDRGGTGDDDLYVMAADGSGVRQITRNDAEDVWPSWSPDGARLAFASDRGGRWAIWTIDATTRSARRFAAGDGGAASPVWSPDGRFIAYARVEQPAPAATTTVIARADTGAVVCTTSSYPLSWSADARELELASNKLGESETVDGTCKPVQPPSGSIAGAFLWAPDGDRVVSCGAFSATGCDADWQPAGQQLNLKTGRS